MVKSPKTKTKKSSWLLLFLQFAPVVLSLVDDIVTVVKDHRSDNPDELPFVINDKGGLSPRDKTMHED